MTLTFIYSQWTKNKKYSLKRFLVMGRYLSQVFDAFVFIRKHSDIFSEKIRVKLLFTLATNTNLTSPPK